MTTIGELQEREVVETARAKVDRGEPLEADERYALNFDLAKVLGKEILSAAAEVRKKKNNIVQYTQGDFDSVKFSIKLVVHAMFNLSAAHSLKRQAIEAEVAKLHERIAALESGGRSLNICGTFDPNKTYRALDVAALGGGSFVARWDQPGPCPGDGWQLLCGQGKRGRPGERGRQGPPGPGHEGI